MKVSKDVFVALSTLQRTAGASRAIDADGLLGAARESGLSPDDLADVMNGTMNGTEHVDLGAMSKSERELTYILAVWFAQVAIVRTEKTNPTYMTFWGARALAKLGDELGLSTAARRRAAAITYDIACLPEPVRPAPYDFQTLAAHLTQRMSEIA